MNRILSAAMALTLLGGTAISAPALAAPYNNGHHVQQQHGRYTPTPPRKMQRWNRGQRVPTTYRNRNRQVDYRRHHLKAPPRGYQWVQDTNSNQFLMIALTTGLIAAIANN